jgi:diaminohydroxyphosphoribosylaminopyrimidine deaminase/5-amino-6-(5-phosphoribosylamino)uracil reductase
MLAPADPRQIDLRHMSRALALALRGQGLVEPNPMVGCVIAHGPDVVGEGWHKEYGGPHAEIEALMAAGPRAAGATLYVTLEPCCHEAKTPPCVPAIVAAGVRRVVAALSDPFPMVDGRGFRALRAAGVEVEVGLMESEARDLCAPFFRLICDNRPWILAKWAMSLDGKIAARGGDSRWISGDAARRVVHDLRRRVDVILVGKNTAILDNPLLTPRPSGPRNPLRVVVDTNASLPLSHKLVATAREAPTLVAVGLSAPREHCGRLAAAGCEVLTCAGKTHDERCSELLVELAGRRMTNVLVEGGGTLLGNLFDNGWIDEIHVFIARKLIGGASAASPLAGLGVDKVQSARRLSRLEFRELDEDLYVSGRLE